jgi:hypothetical protein
MDKKKPLTKVGSSAKNTQVPVKKTAKKIAPVKAEKKREDKAKASVSRTKAASGGKATPFPQVIAAAAKSSPETKKLTKAAEGKKTTGGKPARPISVSESVIPEKKQVKKSPVAVAALKTMSSPEKTVKAVKPIKTAAEKSWEDVSGKTGVKTTRGGRVSAKAESAPKKEKKSAAKELKAALKKKAALKETPAKIREAAGKRLKPKEKPESPLAASRKGVKKKTAATYGVPPRREIKPKRSFDLRVFLPEEELPEEEPHILPPSELPEEYGENELLLLEVDPSRVFASWEIKPEDIAGEAGRLILRVYDVTGIASERVQGRRFFDIPISRRVASKFFDIKMPGRDVIMEIGLLYPEGSFRAITRSHRVSMPELQIFEELGITGLLSDSGTLIGY